MGTDNEQPAVGAVREAVAALTADGLPARLSDPIGSLLELRGVIARSVDPSDRLSRLDALNKLLKQTIRKWPKERERAALAALYGIEKGYPGRTLTDRREGAARHLEYDSTHFRKKVEPRLVDEFSAAVWQDHLRYSPRTKYAPAAVEASGDTPVLGPADYNEQEELVSRIWSEVYGLRAEIIAGGRAKGDQALHHQLPEIRAKIRWRTARLHTYVHEYLQRFGDRILQGDTEWRVDGLIRLAGWRSGLPEDTANQLRLILAANGSDDWRYFLTSDTAKDTD